MKKAKKFFSAILIIFFCLAPFDISKMLPFLNKKEAFAFEEITQDTTWSGEKIISGDISLKKGVTLTMEKGTRVVFTKKYAIFSVQGNLDIRGTVKEPVKIQGVGGETGYSIRANIGSNITIKNADFSGGGNEVYLIAEGSFIKKASAGEFWGAITANGGKIEIQGSTFHDNLAAIKITRGGSNNIKVNRTKFINNDTYDVVCDSLSSCSSDFKYNWWGNANGPDSFAYSWRKYEKIYGNINISPWMTNETFRDPVVIIPGIMGSQKKDGQWQVDPILHTYDNLYDTFVAAGYVPEKDLFMFPYEWRDSNVENAKLLKTKISEIKQIAAWPKVDVVAHSMGGLLAREYIESISYQNDVDQLVALGTPHLGAPKSYLSWDGGDLGPTFSDWILEKIFKQEAEENGFSDLFDYIHQRPLSSVRELLPIYNYLQESDSGNLRSYPTDYPQNTFLENLNTTAKLANLKKVEFSKIIGDLGNDSSTVAGFNVIDADMDKYWEHGYPLGFEIPLGDRGMIMSNGDETVPIYSAESSNIFSDNLLKVNSSHTSLPTDAQKDVIELLTNHRPDSEVNDSLIKNILFVAVYSPVDIMIVAPDGNRIGKDSGTNQSINEIKEAYYTGFDTNSEFITIPNPIDGEYKIIAQGVGQGEYRLEATSISSDEETGKVKETTTSFTGTVFENEIEEKAFKIIEGDVEDKDITPPTINITSPKEDESYLNNQNLNIEYTLEDDRTEQQNIKKEIYLDNNKLEKNSLDLALENTGEHTIKIEAWDEAGNKSELIVRFRITANLDSIDNNIDHYYDLSLISDSKEVKFLHERIRKMKNLERVEMQSSDKNIPEITQSKLTDVFVKIIEKHLESMIVYLEEKSDSRIEKKASELLKDSLEYLIQSNFR